MSAFMSKPWIAAGEEELCGVPVCTGVYEIRRAGGELLDIGYAGNREPFGLKSAVRAVIDGETDTDIEFRIEVCRQYQSRWLELVLANMTTVDSEFARRIATREITVRGHLSPGRLSA